MNAFATRHRRGLTLLELLGVILVFFIIWSFVFPASESMIRNGRRRQAAADVRTLASAVLAYRQEYGHFPAQDKLDRDKIWKEDILYCSDDIQFQEDGVCRGNAAWLLQCLSVTNNVDNPRRILFLEDAPTRVEDDVLKDPWGNPYVVVVDGNADGWIGRPGTGNIVSSFDVRDDTTSPPRTHTVPGIREGVYAFSWGGSHTNAITSVEAAK